MDWIRATKGKIDVPITEYVSNLINTEIEKGNKHKLKVCVGTDSQEKGKAFKFATVILLVIEGNGAMIMGKTEKDKNYHMTINERMLKEVNKSMNVAKDLCSVLDENDIPIEIHADINDDPSYLSNGAFKQAIGYIRGMGYEYKTKPEAFAASKGADRLAKT